MTWINTSVELPKEGKYVLARHNRGTWHDSTDQKNVNCVVVKLIKGISADEREKMKRGELPNPVVNGYRRSNTYKSSDQHANNLVPYFWKEFGPASFFGQDITEWMEIPD